ncbi:hypothetical protein PIB30_042554 [Stylosanthes scabra]|uniref:Fatty acyl-CoA reductase n=1 Tax=Stylosanthes scabra TaxID=79078 RepID=A0ABU6XFL8_9FABA|nr:hypothetical protein [Stylosanthes scabra]
MGEMLLEHLKGNMPLCIIRPTMIISTYKEPFPGWIESAKILDALTVAYGKGKLRFFLANPKGVINLIPADMVVNAMAVAMVAHSNQNNNDIIYHVGSSVSNPIKYHCLPNYAFRYFKENPWIDLHGNPVKVHKVIILDSMASLHRRIFLRYQLPLKEVLELVNAALCRYSQQFCADQNKKIHLVMKLVDLYKPYVFLDALFDNKNTENLLSAAREGEVEMDLFYFDPKIINWEDYLIYIHFPGIIKHVMK